VCGSCGINKFFGLCAALRPLTAPPATKAAPRTEAGHKSLRQEAVLWKSPLEIGESKRKFWLI
jgi:hypothetical protein